MKRAGVLRLPLASDRRDQRLAVLAQIIRNAVNFVGYAAQNLAEPTLRLVAQTNFGSRDSEISQLCCNSVELVALRELAQVGACSSTMSMHSKRRRGDKAALLSVARKPCRRAPIAPSNVVAPPSWTSNCRTSFRERESKTAARARSRTANPRAGAFCALRRWCSRKTHASCRRANRPVTAAFEGRDSQRSADGICSCRVFLFVTQFGPSLHDLSARAPPGF